MIDRSVGIIADFVVGKLMNGRQTLGIDGAAEAAGFRPWGGIGQGGGGGFCHGEGNRGGSIDQTDGDDANDTDAGSSMLEVHS